MVDYVKGLLVAAAVAAGAVFGAAVGLITWRGGLPAASSVATGASASTAFTGTAIAVIAFLRSG